MHFRTAEGASYEGKDEDGHDVFRVSIPPDEHGYFGRQCPSCQQIFRVNHQDYEAAPEGLVLWCTYCGHQAPHSEFITQQQKDRLMQVVRDAGMQLIDNTIGRAFRDMARSTRNNKFISRRVPVEAVLSETSPGHRRRDLDPRTHLPDVPVPLRRLRRPSLLSV